MFTVRRQLTLLVALTAALVLSMPFAQSAAAQGWRQNQGVYEAYDNGYRKGFEQGRDDARDRRAADYARDKDYRKADSGYKGRYGDREWYRNEFRRGYVAGYTRGYNEVARQYGYDDRYGGYRDDRYRNDGYVYGNRRAYPPQGRVAVNIGFDRGYKDGIEKGMEDVRHRRSYDMQRHKWYRNADRDYHREYGPRLNYEAAYRQGFARGYAEGYRARRLF